MRLEALVLRVVSTAAAALAVGWLAGLRVNLTESIPRGVYRVVRSDSDQSAVRRSEIVLVCLPPNVAAFARARGYVPGGGGCAAGTMPVGKVVLAVAGDTVAVSAHGLFVDGRSVAESAPLARDSEGRPLPRLAERSCVVQRGEVWLGSRSARGFDSRYFGVVPASAVRARLVRVWLAVRAAYARPTYPSVTSGRQTPMCEASRRSGPYEGEGGLTSCELPGR